VITTFLTLLLYLALIAGAAYLLLWVLDAVGLAVPPPIRQIIIVIAVLLALLVIWQSIGGVRLS
jgi:hypothetical protein